MEFPSLKTIKIWSGFWSKLFHLQWISWNLKTIYIYIYFTTTFQGTKLTNDSKPKVRWRQQRCLSLSGQAEWLNYARQMTEERIERNGTEWGRVDHSVILNQINDLKGRTEFLKTGMDNLMAEVQMGSEPGRGHKCHSPPMPCRHLKSSSGCSRDEHQALGTVIHSNDINPGCLGHKGDFCYPVM